MCVCKRERESVCVCVCVCVRERESVCVCVCVCEGERESVRVRERERETLKVFRYLASIHLNNLTHSTVLFTYTFSAIDFSFQRSHSEYCPCEVPL